MSEWTATDPNGRTIVFPNWAEYMHYIETRRRIEYYEQLRQERMQRYPITYPTTSIGTSCSQNGMNEKSNRIYTDIDKLDKQKEGKMSYKMVTCSCCGKKRREYNTQQINGKTVCRKCKNICFKRDYFDETTLIQVKQRPDGEYIAPEGYGFIKNYYSPYVSKIETLEARGYVKCEECEYYVLERNLVTIEGKKVCQSCIPQGYRRCNKCGEYHDILKMRQDSNGSYYCDECAKLLVRCPQCGRYEIKDNLRERNGQLYCQDCWSRLVSRAVRSYHDSSVRYEKRSTQADIPLTDKTCYFGFELEVSGDRSKALDFLEVENIDHEVVLMSDSSIKDGGFEIVTMPMTKNYIDEVFIPKFKAALQFLRDNDFKGHNYGGLHIHISQDAVTNKQVAQLSEILYGSYRDQKIWLGITQRKANEMNSWSKMSNRMGDFYTAYTQPEENGKAAVGSPRYTALCKDDRTKTYEFRIFNSNIRIERFLKNYECVLALLDYTKANENNPLPVCNTAGFISYVYENEGKYENLYKFFVEREIREHFRNGYNDSEVERCA